MAEVRLVDLRKDFGAQTVIPELNVTVPDGSFTVLVGPSGCGKSTLLRTIAGLEKPTSGSVEIGGTDVTAKLPSERGIAMVFQSYALYPHMTVRDNISFGLRLAGRPKAEIDTKVGQAAEILQLQDYLDRKPSALSGGQRQRVAIGRAIVRDPSVFLFDEPLSNLDASLRSQMRVELMELHQRLGATMVYVTHDQVEAMTMADKIVVMNGGRIEQTGSPLKIFDRPETPFVAGFIGSPRINFFKGEQAEKMNADTIAVRPEDLTFVEGEGRWRGRIRLIEQLGTDTLVHVQLTDGSEAVLRSGRLGSEMQGSEVALDCDDAKFHRFRDGRRIAA